jgi:hypothetical protein
MAGAQLALGLQGAGEPREAAADYRYFCHFSIRRPPRGGLLSMQSRFRLPAAGMKPGGRRGFGEDWRGLSDLVPKLHNIRRPHGGNGFVKFGRLRRRFLLRVQRGESSR